MFDIIDTMYIRARIGLSRFVSQLKEEEKGVSNFVATIILILIVVLMCALFYKQLTGWFEKLWQQITGDAMGSLQQETT